MSGSQTTKWLPCALLLLLCLAFQTPSPTPKNEEYKDASTWKEVIYDGVPVRIGLDRATGFDNQPKGGVPARRWTPIRDIYVFVDDKYWDIKKMRGICLKIAEEKPDPNRMHVNLCNSEERLKESIRAGLLPWKVEAVQISPIDGENHQEGKVLKTAMLSRFGEEKDFIYWEGNHEKYREKIK